MSFLFVITIGIFVVLGNDATAVPNVARVPTSIRGDQSPGVKYHDVFTPLPRVDLQQYYGNYDYPSFDMGYRPIPPNKKRCPLCDSSVYPYCSDKLLHDACCCTNSYTQELPYQCKLADCRFLHANSCREHRLIANCCCSDDYRSFIKSLLKA